MTLKAVIFDMDGVLVDSIKYHLDAWKKAFETEGVNLSIEDFAMYEGVSSSDTMVVLERDHNVKLSQEQEQNIVSVKNKLFDEAYKRGVYTGIKEFVLYLKSKSLKVVVVTGSARYLAERIINEEFPNMFDFLVTSSDVLRGKPYPEPYLKAVDLLNLDKEDCLVIENAPMGIESAKKAGLKVYALETTLPKNHLVKADKIFKNHEEMIEYVKENLVNN